MVVGQPQTRRKHGRKSRPYALDTFLVTLGECSGGFGVMAALKSRSNPVKIPSSGSKS